ncbi:helix-turn-helix domain-containing protein [Ramlibacter sp. AN1015]|uniref:helix-turn-helix domain-containing protein n=1 Tax=Ramlibacter sp. AN1015 TaxID=3133428 RepID=UPI0030BCC5CF
MPNIAAVLKTEIARVARKEIRAETGAFAKTNAEQRKQIYALRRQVGELQRALKQLQRGQRSSASTKENPQSEVGPALRWRPEGFAQHRKRLGVSAEQMSRLIGCSALSVYKWEAGKVRPRQAQLDAIARVRKLSKSEAMQQLEASA